eukprot:GILK01004299.1.p1 GENE.GILK01004299.1~~GILK01004299.1.p1  ORF type:complete len:358 (-),score=28.31 GILK01004299.1:72-1145(-)
MGTLFLTSVYGDQGAHRPSFFELIGQDRLLLSLRPAFKYVLNLIVSQHPKLWPAMKFSDELLYSALFFIERSYLKNHNASFGENFYGLHRVEVQHAADQVTRGLSRRSRYLSLLFLVLVPYIKAKLDQLYSDLGGGVVNSWQASTSSPTSPPWKARLRAIFLKTYPFLHASYEGSFFLFQLLYLFNRTRYYTPLLAAQGVELQRVSQEVSEFQTQLLAKRDQEWREHLNQSFFLKRWLSLFVNHSMQYGSQALYMSIFGVKFLEWWYSNESLLKPLREVVVPPPPPVPDTRQGSVNLPQDRTLCPICQKKRTNAAASASGYVFCYPCLFAYVTEHRRCPVTDIPTSTAQIRKLYDRP